MFERMARKWILQHQFMFLKALVFVMMDLTSEVCYLPIIAVLMKSQSLLVLLQPFSFVPTSVLCIDCGFMSDVPYLIGQNLYLPNFFVCAKTCSRPESNTKLTAMSCQMN